MYKRHTYVFLRNVAESRVRAAFDLPVSDKIPLDTLLKEAPFILKDIAFRRAIEDKGRKPEDLIESTCKYSKDEDIFTVVVTFKK